MQPPSSDIDRLISLYLSRRASQREKEALENWLQASPTNREIFEQIEKLWHASDNKKARTEEARVNQSAIRDQIWQIGTQQSPPTKAPFRPTIDLFYWSKVAATFIIFLMGAGLLSYLIKEDHKRSNILISPPAIAWIHKENLAGQKSVHRLPDNTQVWLNAESSLVYQEEFSDTLRLVQLQGEAFFEVAQDQSRPFIVEAAETRIQALGTAFNIHAYPEDSVVRVALREGKVRVKKSQQARNTILSPGEELLITKDKEGFDRQSFDYESTLGWKEGILIFNGADFTAFRRAIERWYGVRVKVVGIVPADWRIRARYQQEDLRHVLRDISFNKKIAFELNDKNVLITF